MTPIEIAKLRCAELQQQLDANVPQFRTVLKELHDNIKQTPELVYALDDSEIASIVAGLSKFTGVEISQAKSKEKINKKQASLLSAEDV